MPVLNRPQVVKIDGNLSSSLTFVTVTESFACETSNNADTTNLYATQRTTGAENRHHQ